MRQLLAAALALSFCTALSAQISLGAQYQWVDQNGQMVFSDQPPPASVPLSRILRVGDPVAPPSRAGAGGANVGEQEPLGASNPANSQESRQATRASVSEQMAAFDKRRAMRKDERRKRAQQARQAKATAKSCERMQLSKAQLDSGRRLRIRNKEGVLAPLTEAERLEHAKALTKELKKCRS